jgi:hypothetical protein
MNNTKNARIKLKRHGIASPKRHFLNICIRLVLGISIETTSFFCKNSIVLLIFIFFFLEGICDNC